MELVLVRAINWFADIIVILLMIRAILSWFVAGGNETVRNIYQMMLTLTEPFVAPFRKLLQNVNTGMFDFSVLIAFFAIQIVARILTILITIIF